MKVAIDIPKTAAYILINGDNAEDHLLTAASSFTLIAEQIGAVEDSAFSDTHPPPVATR